MLVIDLFKNCDLENVIKEFIRLGYFDVVRELDSYKKHLSLEEPNKLFVTNEKLLLFVFEKLEIKVRDVISEISQMTVKETDTICGVIEYKDTDLNEDIITSFDVFCFEKDDLKKYIPGILKKIQKTDDLKKQDHSPITTYNFMFEDWETILGYKLSNISLKKYDKDVIAAAILHEITWFGYDYESAKENREKEQNILESRLEFDIEECVSLEDALKEMKAKIECNLNETEEERKERKRQEYLLKEKAKINQEIVTVENYNTMIDYWNICYFEWEVKEV
ncbi:DUF6557 family protein [Lacrimispora amygdalina]|uniref:DUF6557 family protein n=1 Tax=Lacrimispora amygdalina TaxID=253257 RepID=UPI000BE2E043|nr:DUF6557 family protein [Lacrimispora amygdalina]